DFFRTGRQAWGKMPRTSSCRPFADHALASAGTVCLLRWQRVARIANLSGQSEDRTTEILPPCSFSKRLPPFRIYWRMVVLGRTWVAPAQELLLHAGPRAFADGARKSL